MKRPLKNDPSHAFFLTNDVHKTQRRRHELVRDICDADDQMKDQSKWRDSRSKLSPKQKLPTVLSAAKFGH